jgi:AcrR family transcriptional regulator
LIRPGGRPKAADAALIADRIVTVAAERFLRDGYAATSIEAIAAQAGVSKRTFYARFPDKPAILVAVIDRLVHEWLRGFDHALDATHSTEEALLTIARKTLDVALSPTALALHALITAESMRFPEIPRALAASGADAGTTRVAALLQARHPALTPEAAAIAAQQFQGMVIHAPQAQAIAGASMDAASRDHWCKAAVTTLLQGACLPLD